VFFPNVFHHDFKLCLVGGDVAIADVGTGAGCGLAKGCWELDEAVISDAMMNAVYTNLQVANIGEIQYVQQQNSSVDREVRTRLTVAPKLAI
jgi:hypothetical protein